MKHHRPFASELAVRKIRGCLAYAATLLSAAVTYFCPSAIRRRASIFAGFTLLLLVSRGLRAEDFIYYTNGGITISAYTGPGGSVSIPSRINGLPVTIIGNNAFGVNGNLTAIKIPASVRSIGDGAFGGCSSLKQVYFEGDAPWTIGIGAFELGNLRFYYLPGTGGWDLMLFWGYPLVLWNPQAQTNDPSFGLRQSRFGFNIAGTADIPIVIEASTNLAAQSWVVLQSSTLTNGLIYFSDPQWTNYPGRFYHIRWP